MIYLMQTNGSTINRLQHENNEPIGITDIKEFPWFEDEETEIGVIPAKGGDILLVPVLPRDEEEEDDEHLVSANMPASSHAQFGNEQPILAEIVLLVNSIEDLQTDFRQLLARPAEDGFIDSRWALGKVKRKKHRADCKLSDSHAGITYILTGEHAGNYQVQAFIERE